ncbi:class I SAM-dependent methyltransferase [Pseudarthrobacter sp. P1]|uniref:class I SAM-dependent methyltransferase n=1 Tax=Pseudarthrobacter sp. P1 TaxID=3418418 RepID=UPI003CF0B988
MDALPPTHLLRGRANAAGLALLDAAMDALLGTRKRRVFANLPADVVELGPGTGANFRYLAPGTHLAAIEPNPAMHGRLRARAAQHGIELDLHPVAAERIDLPDACADAVLSSLVLCTVTDPAQVLAEVLRVLRPGGRFAFVEHVAAREGTLTRRLQHALRRPWAWCFEGCSCERDLATLIRGAGFGSVELHPYTLRTPVLVFNTQLAGIAVKKRSGAGPLDGSG